jgi:hypothetical protein
MNTKCGDPFIVTRHVGSGPVLSQKESSSSRWWLHVFIDISVTAAELKVLHGIVRGFSMAFSGETMSNSMFRQKNKERNHFLRENKGPYA